MSFCLLPSLPLKHEPFPLPPLKNDFPRIIQARHFYLWALETLTYLEICYICSNMTYFWEFAQQKKSIFRGKTFNSPLPTAYDAPKTFLDIFLVHVLPWMNLFVINSYFCEKPTTEISFLLLKFPFSLFFFFVEILVEFYLKSQLQKK